MRALGKFGVAAALAAYPFILASIVLSPWFNIHNNALSYLGNTASNGQVGYAYDSGLVVAGAMISSFALLLSRVGDRRGLAWTIPLLVAAVDLALVGIFL